MKRTLFAMQCLAEPSQVDVVILLAEKARLTVVSPLYDMYRDTVEMDTRATWHESRITEIEPDPFFLPFSLKIVAVLEDEVVTVVTNYPLKKRATK